MKDLTWQPPTEGRILVKVHSCGVGLPDEWITTGKYPLLPTPPAIPGQEVSGEVVGVPPNSAFSVGDRVMGVTAFLEGWGGYSHYAYVQETLAQRVPDSLTDDEAAGFIVGFQTGYDALVNRGALRSGERVLVLGATGSSGVTAIQLAKALGATVIAVTSSESKAAFCASIGADHVINWKATNLVDEVQEITDGRGVDIVFDTVGGELGTQATKTVARLGRFVLIGYASGSWTTLDQLDMVLRNYSAVGIFAGGFTPEEDRAALDHLYELAASEAIKTPIGGVYSFDEVPSVLQRITDGKTLPGKSIVRISQPIR